MPHYYLNRNHQNSGEHEVHKAGARMILGMEIESIWAGVQMITRLLARRSAW